nr:hypothetical protein TorRG33x02_078920 [Ipomoea batatas]
MRIHDEHSTILQCLRSKRKIVARKMTLVRYFNEASEGGEIVIAPLSDFLASRYISRLVFGELLGSFPDFINPSGELDDNERLVESPEVLGVAVELQGGLEVSYGGLCAFQMGCNVR